MGHFNLCVNLQKGDALCVSKCRATRTNWTCPASSYTDTLQLLVNYFPLDSLVFRQYIKLPPQWYSHPVFGWVFPRHGERYIWRPRVPVNTCSSDDHVHDSRKPLTAGVSQTLSSVLVGDAFRLSLVQRRDWQLGAVDEPNFPRRQVACIRVAADGTLLGAWLPGCCHCLVLPQTWSRKGNEALRSFFPRLSRLKLLFETKI